MNVKQFCLILCLFSNSFLAAQRDPITVLIEQQNWNDTLSLSAKAEKVYDWVREHIIYQKADFHRSPNGSEDLTDLAIKALKSRKAVCMGYASLTVKLLNSLDVPAHLVEGYVLKDESVEAHAWIVFKINRQWFLGDPTWDAGYFHEGKYIKNKDRKYFQMNPKEFIEDHYPFDPAFQLLEYPYHYRSFLKGEKPCQADHLAFKPILDTYSSRDKIQQLKRSLRYKTNDHYVRHELGVAIMDRAEAKIKPCLSGYNLTQSFPETCYETAEQVEFLLVEAISHFETILKDPGDFRQMAQINLKVAQANMNNLRNLKSELD